MQYKRSTVPYEAWQKYLPDITPRQLHDSFAKAAGPENNIQMTVTLSPGYRPHIEIRHNSSWHSGDRDNIILFHITKNHTVELNRLFLNAPDQGKHLAKRYLETAATLFKEKMDCNRMELKTTGVGNYAWAKYGFCPDTKLDWRKATIYLRRHLSDDHDAVLFKGHRYPITPAEKRSIETVIATELAGAPTRFPQLTELNRVIGHYDGKPLTVGKALLLEVNWKGALPLKEGHPSYERFMAYAAPVESMQEMAV